MGETAKPRESFYPLSFGHPHFFGGELKKK